jgi:MFS family permease
LNSTFAALKYRNYRLWFSGQLVSVIGTWMQSTAQQYLVYDLTNSTRLLGLVTFASGLPAIILTPFTGVIADRIPRRTLLIITQSFMLVLAFILAILNFTNVVQYWHIIILAFLLGVANAFDAPARQSFAIELVDDRKDMTNAIALNAAMFNMATVVGPAASGMIYFLVGPALCFTINGISFIAVIIALLMMKLRPFVPHPSEGNVFKEISTGFKYVLSRNIILWLIISLGVVSLIGFGVSSQSPAWAKGVLFGDERTNGWMMTFRGVGSLVGALLVASVGKRKMRGRLWTIGSFILPASLGLMAIIPLLNISKSSMVAGTMVMVAIMGGAMMLIANTSNAMIQSDVPDHLRGRVMGIYTLIFMGAMPIGSLIIGNVAPFITLPITVGVFAVMLLLYSVSVLIFNPRIRHMDQHIKTDEQLALDK